jgi:hypothetical protein
MARKTCQRLALDRLGTVVHRQLHGAVAGLGHKHYRKQFYSDGATDRHCPKAICERDGPVSNMQNTILISTGIVAALPLVPVGHFLCFGWRARKQQIISRLSDTSILLYKQTFCPKISFVDSAGFEKDYKARYGRQLFFFPLLLFIAALLFPAYLSVSWTFSHDWTSAGEGIAKIAIFSLAGAYLWITYDLIIRARQNDIVTSDLNRATLRLLVSLPFGFAISAFAGVLTGSAVTLSTGALAFFVGAFPTDTVLKFMRRTAAIPLKLDADTSGDDVQQLTKIDGISVPIAERFIDEGVKTNLQLAYADPVALTIKSCMDFAFIMDCCGQALVRTYFNDDRMKIVWKYGLRTGVEVKTLNDELVISDTVKDVAVTVGTAAPAPSPARIQLDNLATALALDTASTRFIIDQIAADPYTIFQFEVWATPAEQLPKTDVSRVVAPDQAMPEDLRLYYDKARELNEFFSDGLKPRERWHILKQQAAPLVLAAIGYLFATLGLRFFTGIAFAQTGADKTTAFGFTQYEWLVVVYVTYNVVVIGILLTLVTMIVRGTRSQWVWRTASFLLGFLVKSISAFPST